MENEYKELNSAFCKALMKMDKPGAIGVIQRSLDEENIKVKDLYVNVLAPALGSIASNESKQTIPIWQEHVHSGIVRTALEIAYPHVIRQIKPSPQKLKAIVLCLEEEYHELGARMITDFLTIIGFESIFIGANTPKNEILDAIRTLSPNLVCISVTNYYHLTRLKDLIILMNHEYQEKTFKTLVGGYAVDHTPHAKEIIGADFYASSFEDLEKIKEALL